MAARREKTGPQPVSRILEGMLRESGLRDRLQGRAALLGWREIVGTEIADHSRAVDLVDGVLTLDADHGAWRQEVTMLVPEIMRKFNARYGEGTVTTIAWVDRPRRGRRPESKP